MNQLPKDALETVAAVAQARQTIKVVSEHPLSCQTNHALIDRLIAIAGMAPFHRVCDEVHRDESSQLKGIEPWRFYVVDASHCRKLMARIPLEGAGKIPAMLASADAMIMSTWLPNQPGTAGSQESGTANPAAAEPVQSPVIEATLGNIEHLAAAASAIQTLLLAATAAGITNYWSSGGVLRSRQVYQLLEIPAEEQLLGAIFLFPSSVELSNGVERLPSKLREHRSAPSQWSRWVTLD